MTRQGRPTFSMLFQLSLDGFCGAAEGQKREVQEVFGDDGQAAPQRLSEEEDGDEEEGVGGAEAEEEVGQAGASWRSTRSLPSPGDLKTPIQKALMKHCLSRCQPG